MENNQKTQIFAKGSKTFFSSSKFFPKETREQVTTLYAFVRQIDDLVDVIPQKDTEFYKYRDLFFGARQGVISGNRVIDDFAQLEKSLQIDPEWMDAFFISMEKDLNGDKYNTLEDTLGYIYGSASIVGLILAKILKLPTIAYPYAEKLGKSFQYINFIRDIYEDLELNRMYFPKEDLTRFKIKSLDCSSKDFDEGKFVIFMNYQIDRYEKWQKEAEKGFKYIPKQLLVPIRTASDVYKWTAKQIRKNPMLVYQKKIKPSGVRVWLTGIRNLWLEWR